MKTRLVNYQDGEVNLMFSLDRPKLTIGRQMGNMAQLPHEQVSKQHAVVVREGETWFIQDLKSRNGTFVNGQKQERAELKDRDKIKIGPFEFHFEMDVPSDDFVPAYIIDPSPSAAERTIADPGPKDEKST